MMLINDDTTKSRVNTISEKHNHKTHLYYAFDFEAITPDY